MINKKPILPTEVVRKNYLNIRKGNEFDSNKLLEIRSGI